MARDLQCCTQHRGMQIAREGEREGGEAHEGAGVFVDGDAVEVALHLREVVVRTLLQPRVHAGEEVVRQRPGEGANGTKAIPQLHPRPPTIIASCLHLSSGIMRNTDPLLVK